MQTSTTFPEKIAIFDLDNTIASWPKFAIPAYTEMIRTIHNLTQLPIQTIKSEMRKVYEKAGTIEYPPLIQEMPSLKNHPNLETIITKTKQKFSATKRRELTPYPKIEELLQNLQSNNFTNIILSDAPYIQGAKRINILGLSSYFYGLIGLKSHSKYQIPIKFLKPKLTFPFKTEISTKEKPYTNLPSILSKLFNQTITTEFIKSNCLYFGDNQFKDGELIKIWGMKGFLAIYGQHTTENIKDLLEITPNHIITKHFSENHLHQTVDSDYKIIPAKTVDEILNHLKMSNYEISKV